jgi:hypothetical protein
LDNRCQIAFLNKSYLPDIATSSASIQTIRRTAAKTPIFTCKQARLPTLALAKLVRMTRSGNYSFTIENFGRLFGELLRKNPYNSGF